MKKAHPEDICEMCGNRNLRSWFVDSVLWNRVVGYDWSVLCPICFAILAEKKGVLPTAWELVPEKLGKERTCRRDAGIDTQDACATRENAL